jgi:hypothetical protein
MSGGAKLMKITLFDSAQSDVAVILSEVEGWKTLSD